MRKLKEPCRSCGKPLDPRWRVCPYCEAEVVGRTRRAPRERPRAAGASGPRASERPSGSRPSRARRSVDAPAALRTGAGIDGDELASAPAQRGTLTAPARASHVAASAEAIASRAVIANPDPGQARRLRARPDRRGDRPLRAQGPADRGAEADAGRPRAGRAALRRARREAVLRRAGRVHHARPAGRDGARGRRAP